jgi:ubiquinone/menaquinone biosynthesis C-methylase UbiE
MSANFKVVQSHFYDDETVAKYDKLTGGVTAALGEYVVKGIEPGALEGKAILDNAAGTGVMTRLLLARSEQMTIEAVDISPVMTKHLKATITPTNSSKINVQTEDATVLSFLL